jgi:hypothetical protein
MDKVQKLNSNEGRYCLCLHVGNVFTGNVGTSVYYTIQYNSPAQQDVVRILNVLMKEKTTMTCLITVADTGISRQEDSSVQVCATQFREIWRKLEGTAVLLTTGRSHAAAHSRDDHG